MICIMNDRRSHEDGWRAGEPPWAASPLLFSLNLAHSSAAFGLPVIDRSGKSQSHVLGDLQDAARWAKAVPLATDPGKPLSTTSQ